MDPVYEVLSHFQRREFEICVDKCTIILEKNPYDESIWSLKTRAMTAQVMVDDNDCDEEGKCLVHKLGTVDNRRQGRTRPLTWCDLLDGYIDRLHKYQVLGLSYSQ